MMTEDCKARNGGHPVVVNLEKQDLGLIAFGQGQSSTTANARVSGNPYNANVSGVATTWVISPWRKPALALLGGSVAGDPLRAKSHRRTLEQRKTCRCINGRGVRVAAA